MRDEVDVVVVGGGAAGIAAARRLMREPGLSLLLVEAGGRLGGRAHTVGEAVPLDLGCAWLHSGLTNAWTGIADATPGFAVDRRPAPWQDPDHDMGLGPEDGRDFDGAMAAFHASVLAAAARGGDEPLSDLVPPHSPWRGLLDAYSTFVSGAELDRISVVDTADYAPGEGDDWRVVEGYGRLVAHHGRDIPAVLDTPVRRIDHSRTGRIAVETDRGSVSARAVIVTVSTDMLARERIRFHPALPGKAEAAAGLPLGLADKLFLGLTRPELFPVEGYCLGSAATGRTAAYHMRPFGRPIIECFYGGALARDLEREGEAAALAFARAEIAGQLGAEAAAAIEPIVMTAWAGEPHIGGSYAYARPGSAGMRARLAAPVEERLYFAGEACHVTRFTTAHGAYETGVAAADGVLASPALKAATRAAVS